MSSPDLSGGARLAPAPPPPRRGIRPFDLPDMGEQAPAAPEPEAEPSLPPGFTPLLIMEKPPEDPRESAERQARRMLDSAKAEAEAMLKSAQQDGYQTGYQKGYQTGLDEGLVASRARIEAACDNLGRALAVLERARAGILGVMETEIIALVQAATDRILLAPEAIDPALVQRAVREAVTRVAEAERVVVRLHPDDIGHVREFRPRLLGELGGLAHLELRPDPALRPGDCLVDTPTAQVDATLASRREQIFKLLSETFHQGAGLDMEALLVRAMDQPAPAAAPPAAAAPAAAEDALEADAQTPPPAPSQPAAASDLEDW